MPIIYIEGIKTTLLTLFGSILGFIGGKVDSALNNTRFMTSPSEFTNFQIFNFQLLVRSRRDPEDKIAGTDPDNFTDSKSFQKYFQRP
jgi:hypothetical protein